MRFNRKILTYHSSKAISGRTKDAGAYAQVFNTDNEPTVEEGMMLDGKETKKAKPGIYLEMSLL